MGPIVYLFLRALLRLFMVMKGPMRRHWMLLLVLPHFSPSPKTTYISTCSLHFIIFGTSGGRARLVWTRYGSSQHGYYISCCISGIAKSLAHLFTGHICYMHCFLLSQVQPFCDDCLIPLSVLHLLVERLSLVDLWEQFFSRCQDRDWTFSLICWEKMWSVGHYVINYLEELAVLHLV